jgi:Domain of unknown function (DUF4253)
MASAQLPSKGPVRLGSVDLPSGRLLSGHFEGETVVWATDHPVPRSGWVWAELSALHPHTGLVPIQLDSLSGQPRRPWDNWEFSVPEDPREADGIDVAALLESEWRDVVAEAEDDPEWRGMWAPFGPAWPGLAPAERTPLTPAQRKRGLDAVLPGIRGSHGATSDARIGLVAAERPADVLAVTGWGGTDNRGDLLLPLTAVLRSWEDRFGARVIDVGFADLRLFVERPPRTRQAALLLAAEQVHLADDCIDGHRDVRRIAARLLNGLVWTFWWD